MATRAKNRNIFKWCLFSHRPIHHLLMCQDSGEPSWALGPSCLCLPCLYTGKTGSTTWPPCFWMDHRTLVKSGYPKTNFLISQPKHMLWVLKRTVAMRRFFWAPKTYVKTDGQENIYNFMLKNFVYLNLWDLNMLCILGRGSPKDQFVKLWNLPSCFWQVVFFI